MNNKNIILLIILVILFMKVKGCSFKENFSENNSDSSHYVIFYTNNDDRDKLVSIPKHGNFIRVIDEESGEIDDQIGINNSLGNDIISCPPIIVEKNIIFGTNDGYIHCFDLEEKERKWKKRISLEGGKDWFPFTYLLHRNNNIYAINEGSIFSININDGKLNWHYFESY